MKYRYDPSVRSVQQPPHHRQNESAFPGISEPFFSGGGGSTGSGLPVPFDTSQFQSGSTPSIFIQPATTPINMSPAIPTQTGELVEPAKESSGFSFGNSLNDLKGFVDRMGGIDGIVSTMTKVQKVVSSVTQMAPLIKVLAGSFGKKGASAASAADDSVEGYRPRRKKRRRTGSGASAAPGGGQRRRPRRRKR